MHPLVIASALSRCLALFSALLLVACSAMLPRAHSGTTSFPDFESARVGIESLLPGQSNMRALEALGIDPAKQPNVTILSYPDLVRRFSTGVSGGAGSVELDPSVMACLTAHGRCRGLELNISEIRKNRTGPFFYDFVNFMRRTEITGWRFNALILLVDDIVVYRAWGGQPHVSELEVTRNPLGPLQDIGPSLVR
jgi:hypothetical protein